MTGINYEYWDSCIFLAFLQEEEHKPGELDYIKESAYKFDQGTLGILTSSITLVEVYEARLDATQKSTFKSMYSRSNFVFIDASREICNLASEIRSYYRQHTVNANGVDLYPSAPDALHVASALAGQDALNKPVNLITLDSRNKAKNNELALTYLSGKVADKYTLTICRPPVKNIQLNLIQASC